MDACISPPSPPSPLSPSPLSPLSLYLGRVRLYVQDSLKETKELHLSEAKGTLISHPYLLAVLEEWEESHRDHALLVGGQANLTGQAVSICNTQGAWPRWINGIITSHNQQTKVLEFPSLELVKM